MAPMLHKNLRKALYLTLACSSLARDPMCTTGIRNGSACCVASCGSCGGSGCSERVGGAAACCSNVIAQANKSCTQTDPPCIVGPSDTCTLQKGTEYIGNDITAPLATKGVGECCASCSANTKCVFFTYEGGTTGLCHLKNTNAPDSSRPNATVTSGYPGTDPPPPTPAATDYHVRITSRVSETGPNFVCWNIDASENRGFFWRNLSNSSAYGAKLARQASALALDQAAGYSLLRFGGSGNDYLTYAFGGTPCPPSSDYTQCLNESSWRALLSFTEASNARMIFGLSMNTGHDFASAASAGPFPYPWDPSNAKAILSWTIAQGLDHLLFGFELGNEQNTQYTAAQTANDFAVLHRLTIELWPDETKRPKLFGPDPHSLHGPSGAQLQWTSDWLRHCQTLGVPVYGVTHHEYTEVDPTIGGFTAPTRLALNSAIAAAMNETVRSVDPHVLIFGGEIGPHNGGSPPCDHSSMRWAVYGDSLWYADALAAKARHGYAGFCRQDYIGADYGLVDCSTGAPLPDFYAALLWTHVMGSIVLNVELSDNGGKRLGDDPVVRAYAHCLNAKESTQTANGGAGLMVINLSNKSTTVHFDAALGDLARVYVLEPSDDASASLTGVGGLLGTGVTLNGKLQEAAADGTVPRPTPQVAATTSNATLPAHAIAFYVLPKAFLPDCPWS